MLPVYGELIGAGEWEPEAEHWVRWVRTESHDAYWYYRDEFFDSVVPQPGLLTVEIGCGEGRVSRDLLSRGHRVVAVDTSWTLLRYARTSSPAIPFLLADAAGLPLQEECLDVVVAYNSLQVVADMHTTVREAARVLCRGGCLCACTSHPMTDMGRFTSDEPGASYAIRQSYFDRRRVEDTVEREGLTMTFRGWTYSLEDYAVALEEAGPRIEAIREPVPRGANGRYDRWKRVPMFLMIRAVKL